MSQTKPSNRKPLSEIHRENHRGSLELACRLMLHDRPAAFRLLELAKTSRFYFARLRAIGE